MEYWFANADAQFQALLVVVVAAFLGGLIGVERDLADKPVGIRTLMLVAGTSALLMLLGLRFTDPYAVPGNAPDMHIDPLRVIQSIVLGIGFICAGTIIRQRQGTHVEGLTTAATILLVSGIGICTALGQVILAAGATLLSILILVSLRAVDDRLRRMRYTNHDE